MYLTAFQMGKSYIKGKTSDLDTINQRQIIGASVMGQLISEI